MTAYYYVVMSIMDARKYKLYNAFHVALFSVEGWEIASTRLNYHPHVFAIE